MWWREGGKGGLMLFWGGILIFFFCLLLLRIFLWCLLSWWKGGIKGGMERRRGRGRCIWNLRCGIGISVRGGWRWYLSWRKGVWILIDCGLLGLLLLVVVLIIVVGGGIVGGS